MEEQVATPGAHREVADLVNDQQVVAAQELHPLAQPALALGLAHGVHQLGQRGEEHALASLDRLEAQSDGQVALARTRRAQEVHTLTPLDEVQIRQRQHARTIQPGLEAEVIARDRLDGAQPCSLQRHLDAPALPSAVLLSQQRFDRLQRRDLALFNPRQGRLQGLKSTGHTQAYQVAADALGGVAHRAPPR